MRDLFGQDWSGNSASAGAGRKPVFFWQGLLILLPVSVMAVIGLTAIFRDKVAVEQDARQRAKELLEQMAPDVGRGFAASLVDFDLEGDSWFERSRLRLANLCAGSNVSGVVGIGSAQPLDRTPLSHALPARGRLADPGLPPEEVCPSHVFFVSEAVSEWASVDEPVPGLPTWLIEFSEAQHRTWEELRSRCDGVPTEGEFEAVMQAFRLTDPSEPATANSEFLRLKRELMSRSLPQPVSTCVRFARQHRAVAAESGVPLSNLAMAEALRNARSGPELAEALGALTEEVFATPSLLIPELEEEARKAIGRLAASKELLGTVEGLWAAQERLRRIVSSLERAGWLGGCTNLWVDAAGQRWFCFVRTGGWNSSVARTNMPMGGTVFAYPKGSLVELRTYPKIVIERAFARANSQIRRSAPKYASLAAELAEEPLELEGGFSNRRSVGEALARSRQRLVLTEASGGSQAAARQVESPPITGKVEAAPGLTRNEVGAESQSCWPEYTLRLDLVDAAGLFVQQRQRTLWFGGVILGAMVTAFAGLQGARRAFYRQLNLSQMKSDFVSSVSHELRAPIASVRLMAESLEHGRIPEVERQKVYFQFIGQECRRLSALIENVLDFSRIEQGRKQYEFEPADLGELVRQTVNLMGTYGAERQVRLVLVEGGAGGSGSGLQPCIDGKAIQQALVNLIDNAMKHSPKEGVVTLGVEAQSGEGGREIRIWVEDRGPGIPLSEQAKIFERFYRSGSELRRQTQGVGIGLSIVKHIVEAHGGRVLVRSFPEQGSRFTIALPLRESSESPWNES